MKKHLLFLVIFIIAVLLFQGCNKKIALSTTGRHKAALYDSTTFDYVFTEALKQKFLGNAGDALKYLEQCIKINPEGDAAYYEMAQIALMLSDQVNGKKYAFKATSLNEKNIWYLMLIANIYYQEKNLDSAVIFYEKIIKYFPERENEKLTLANIYSEKKQYNKAAEIYEYFEKKYGVNEATSISIIKNMINEGDFMKADEKVHQLLIKSPDEILYNELLAEIYRKTGEADKAIEVYKKMLEKNLWRPQMLLSLSDILISEKKYEEFFKIINKIIISDSISREEKISLMSRAVEDSNLIRLSSKELENTLMVFEEENKNDDVIILLRTDLYQKQNKIPEAITRLEEIIKINPDNYYAWEKLLLIYSETKDWNKLFIRGEECATKFNRSFLAKILYANAAMEKDLPDIAAEELRKAMILAGNDTDMQIQVLMMETDLFYRKKEFNKCFEIFNVALKIRPDDILILNNYAYYLAEQGKNLKEAEKMAKLVIDKEKRNTTFLDTYAWVIYKRGRYKEAQKILEEVIKMDNKQDAEWYEHLGFIMKAENNCNKAVEYWKRAYKIDERKKSLEKEIENCGNR